MGIGTGTMKAAVVLGERVDIWLSPPLYERRMWDWRDLAGTVGNVLREAGRREEGEAAYRAISSAASEPAARAKVAMYARVWVGYPDDKSRPSCLTARHLSRNIIP